MRILARKTHKDRQAQGNNAPLPYRARRQVQRASNSPSPLRIVNHRVQTKLHLSTPGDASEIEADRVAEQVLSKPGAQTNCHCGGSCPRCTEKPSIQSKALNTESGFEISSPSVIDETLAAPGRPLDPSSLADMESRFQYNFSQVRIHDNDRADAASTAINARAFTAGHHIVFRRGEFSPQSGSGRKLLAHELTHVIQQGAAQPLNSPSHDTHSGDQSFVSSNSVNAQRKLIQRDQYDYRYPGGIPPQLSDFEKARRACQNRFNWSDGGHWIGIGPEPDCGKRETAKSSSTLTITWPSEDSVIRSREKVNTTRNMLGYIVGGIITTVTAATNTPIIIALLSGTGGSILTDYIPHVVDLVRTGDKLIIRVGVEGTRSAHPWGSNVVTYSNHWQLVDKEGRVKWRTDQSHSYHQRDMNKATFDRMFDSIGQ